MTTVYLAYAILYAFIFIAGSCIGSFLNVLVYRIPNHINFVSGRSFCPSCKNQIPAGDLIPIISYVLLRGKCRSCGQPISIRYPLVELAGGLLAALSVSVFWFTPQAALAFAAACILLAVALIDIDTMEIPDGLVVTILIVAIISIFFVPEITLVSRLIGMVLLSVPMLLMNFIIKDSFGGGDIKLCAVCGILLGWQQMLAAAFIALLTGGAYGIYLLAGKKKGRKDHFAFGPFLSFGITVALFFGNQIVESYVRLFIF